MREKLLVLMKNEGLTSSRLAELLGIQPSGISHILAGRNKPSFDLVQKILRRFPRINPDWLLLDGQEMYRSDENDKTQLSENTILSTDTHNASENGQNDEIAKTQEQGSTVSPNLNTLAQNMSSRGTIKRIIVLYEDRSFESYDIAR